MSLLFPQQLARRWLRERHDDDDADDEGDEGFVDELARVIMST